MFHVKKGQDFQHLKQNGQDINILWKMSNGNTSEHFFKMVIFFIGFIIFTLDLMFLTRTYFYLSTISFMNVVCTNFECQYVIMYTFFSVIIFFLELLLYFYFEILHLPALKNVYHYFFIFFPGCTAVYD